MLYSTSQDAKCTADKQSSTWAANEMYRGKNHTTKRTKQA